MLYQGSRLFAYSPDVVPGIGHDAVEYATPAGSIGCKNDGPLCAVPMQRQGFAHSCIRIVAHGPNISTARDCQRVQEIVLSAIVGAGDNHPCSACPTECRECAGHATTTIVPYGQNSFDAGRASTAVRTLSPPATLGLGTIFHVVPLNCSMSV